MGLADQIKKLEEDLAKFKSGEAYTKLDSKIDDLRYEVEELKDEIKDYEELFDNLRKLLGRF